MTAAGFSGKEADTKASDAIDPVLDYRIHGQAYARTALANYTVQCHADGSQTDVCEYPRGCYRQVHWIPHGVST